VASISLVQQVGEPSLHLVLLAVEVLGNTDLVFFGTVPDESIEVLARPRIDQR
jgi:hypothetical protein